jgi:hypothetical protein
MFLTFQKSGANYSYTLDIGFIESIFTSGKISDKGLLRSNENNGYCIFQLKQLFPQKMSFSIQTVPCYSFKYQFCILTYDLAYIRL